MSEDNRTLEQVLYRVRDKIGDVKNRALDALFVQQETEAHALLDMLQTNGSLIVADDALAARTIADTYGLIKKDARVRDVLGGGPRSYLADAERQLSELLSEVHADSTLEELDKDTQDHVLKTLITLREQTTHLNMDLKVEDLSQICDLGKALYEALEPAARKHRDLDVLTKLYILPYFQGQLHSQAKQYLRDPSREFALVMMDINDFSQYNNFCGHDQADEVLVQLAHLLKTNVNGIVARRSGDELFMLLPDADQDGAAAVTTRLASIIDTELRDCVYEAWTAHGKPYNDAFDQRSKLNLSFGITTPVIEHAPNIVIRTYEDLREQPIEDERYAPVMHALHRIEQAGEENFDYALRAQLKDELSEREREYLGERVYDRLLKEAECALHGAKQLKDGTMSHHFVYDPARDQKDYEYVREDGKTTRLFKKDTFPDSAS